MSKKCAYVFFTSVMVNFLLVIIAVQSDISFDIITWVSIFQIVINILLIWRIKGNFLNLGILFIGLIYLFNFGQSIITTFWKNDRYAYLSVLSNTSKEIYIRAEVFVILCVAFISCGYIWANRKEMLSNKSNIPYNEDELFRIRKKAIVIVLITLLPMLYIDTLKIIAATTQDYLATYSVYQVGLGKYLGVFAQFCKPTISVLLFCYKDEENKARRLFYFSTIYYLFLMVSGDRGTSIIYIITNMFVYFYYIKPLKKKNIFAIVLFGYFLLVAVNVIGYVRDYGLTTEVFAQALNLRNSDGIIYSTLREFGGSIKSLTLAIQYIPSYSDYNYGLTYLLTPLYVSPVLPDFLDDLIATFQTYVRAFPISAQASLGGNCLGELYSNFGILGSVFAFFIGTQIGKIDIKLMMKNSYADTATILVLVPSLLLWVRGYYCSMVLTTFWLGIAFKYIKIGEKSYNETGININNR